MRVGVLRAVRTDSRHDQWADRPHNGRQERCDSIPRPRCAEGEGAIRARSSALERRSMLRANRAGQGGWLAARTAETLGSSNTARSCARAGIPLKSGRRDPVAERERRLPTSLTPARGRGRVLPACRRRACPRLPPQGQVLDPCTSVPDEHQRPYLQSSCLRFGFRQRPTPESPHRWSDRRAPIPAPPSIQEQRCRRRPRSMPRRRR